MTDPVGAAHRSDLDAHLRRLIPELISTQADDGYLGPFRKEERLLGHWDLWGHYHVMLALMLWYEDTGDRAALDCAIRAGDLICRTYLTSRGAGILPAERRIIDAGSPEMNMAVIHALGRLHRHTSDERYLRMMRVAALSAMELLADFTPRLVGPVLVGTADENSAVNLHVFTDSPEMVALELEQLEEDLKEVKRDDAVIRRPKVGHLQQQAGEFVEHD